MSEIVESLDDKAELEPLSFDPWGADLQNPYPVLDRLRAERPVFFSPEINAWCVTRYDDVYAVIRDSARFSSRETFPKPQGLPPEGERVVARYWDEAPMVTLLDPPDHTRVRAALASGFTARAVAKYEPIVEAIVARLIEQLGGRKQFDLVADYASRIPLRVILSVLGITADDHDTVAAWLQQGFTLFVGRRAADEATLVECAHGQELFAQYVKAALHERRIRPRDDLLSILGGGGANERRIEDDEVVSQVMTMIGAGYETVANALANTVRIVLSMPGAWQDFAHGRLAAASIISEGMRMDTPLLGVFRVAKYAAEVGGVHIPAGAMVLLVIASANHDESRYESPAEFRPHRSRLAQDLSFGGGAHYCIGAPLAVLELRVALEYLSRAFPGLRLADRDGPSYRPMSQFRGLDRLQVCVD